MASSTSIIRATASRTGSAPRRVSNWASVSPATYSKTKKVYCSWISASNTGTMLGCLTRPTLRASCSHWRMDWSSVPAAGRNTLIATSRSMRGSKASQTVDCAPCPSWRLSSKRPSILPGFRATGDLCAWLFGRAWESAMPSCYLSCTAPETVTTTQDFPLSMGMGAASASTILAAMGMKRGSGPPG